MKTTLIIIGGLAAALALTLSSCGDGTTSTVVSGETADPPAAQAAGAYPLDVCVVSGEKLGSMGKPVVVNHEGTEVQFCCKECLPEFNEDPGKFVAMVKAGKAGSVDHSKHNQ